MRLETERLILREWRKADCDDLVEGLNNLDVSRWLARVPFPYTAACAANWIAFYAKGVDEANDQSDYFFAIELKDGNKVIGGTSLERISRFHGTAGGGIWLNARYHGFGYGTEAFDRRIAFAFDELGLRRLENGFFEGNDASWRMQEKLGYVREGVRRQGMRCLADGLIKDEILTGLLKEEWRSINGQ